MKKRQVLSPTTAVVPNGPVVQPTLTTRATVTQTVVVPPSQPAGPVRGPGGLILTPVPSSLTTRVTSTPVLPGQPVTTPAPVVPAPASTSIQPITPSVQATVAPAPVAVTTPTTSNTETRAAPTTTTSSSAVPSDASTAGATSKGVSPTAIGVVAGVVALAVVCAIAFFIRRRFLRRRSQRRNTWGAGFYNNNPQFEKQLEPTPQPAYRPTYEPAYQPPREEQHMPNPYDRYPAQQQQISSPPTPLPQSYNNPVSPPPPSAQTFRPPPVVARGGAAEPSTVAVIRVFIPSLPDELHISSGERVRIINAYDDGWALCANLRGEQGVVPLECLDRPQAAGATSQAGDWRNLKRASSLYSATSVPLKGY